MKFSKTILSTLLLASTTAFANTYNGEVGLNYINNGGPIDNRIYPGDNVSAFQIHGTYNFSAVDTTNKPLAEADFLGKHSYINAYFADIDDDGDDVDSQSIGFGFYIPNSIFYIGARYWELENANDTIVSLGITPIDGLLITTSHRDEAEEYNANIAAKYVTKLAGDTALNLEAGYQKGQDAENEFEDDAEDTLYVAADYYFSSRFSVGAKLIDEDDSSYIVRTRYFYTDKVSFNGEFVSDDEENALVVGAAIRF